LREVAGFVDWLDASAVEARLEKIALKQSPKPEWQRNAK